METREAALDWHRRGQGVAIATVVDTWGSAPRPAGSELACNAAGEFVGSVSGGCVEVAVLRAAADVIGGGPPRLLEFGVTDDEAWAVGLACGGRIRVFVDRFADSLTESLLQAIHERRPVATVVNLVAGGERFATSEEADAALRADRAVLLEQDGARKLVVPHNPAPRLVIVGAVHIAETLAKSARLLGHDVWVVDPRTAFLRESLFPGARLAGDWPQQALRAIGPDRRTAGAVLTHDPKIDDPALEELLLSEAYYIGALGSRRTHAQRLERLAGRGFSPSVLARIHGPAGLAIGARTPAEIAISVLAQLVGALRQAS